MNDPQLPDRSASSKEFYEALEQFKSLLESDDSQDNTSKNTPKGQRDSFAEEQEKTQKLNWEEVAADLEDLSD